MRKKNFNLNSEFYCVFCGEKTLNLPRYSGSERECGHLKKLYCFKCKKETNHAEVREYTHYTKEDIEFEIKYHNFDEQGNRILPYGLFRDKMYKEGVTLV